ncbi:helix-turn-helix transcriptional regulator [Streptomyces sp. NPDC051130]|uniref:helix-turn-helix domain-containing protein n=1 Tax=Streptomyces sp. NPDC051130 TaxID=3157223 RepID=UPI003427B41D
MIELRYPDGGPRYTDVEVAEGAGISPQYVRNLRNGKSVPGLAPAMRLAAFFTLANVDYFVMHDSHASVTAVEQRLAELERAKETGQAMPLPRPCAAAAEPDVEAEVEELMRRLQGNHEVLDISHRSARLSPEGKAAATALLGLVERILQPEVDH